MKITRRQIETALIEQVDDSKEKADLVPEHIANRQNPHEVTTVQLGTYNAEEIDRKNDAVANLTYGSAYWYGRRYPETPWPLPDVDPWG